MAKDAFGVVDNSKTPRSNQVKSYLDIEAAAANAVDGAIIGEDANLKIRKDKDGRRIFIMNKVDDCDLNDV